MITSLFPKSKSLHVDRAKARRERAVHATQDLVVVDDEAADRLARLHHKPLATVAARRKVRRKSDAAGDAAAAGELSHHSSTGVGCPLSPLGEIAESRDRSPQCNTAICAKPPMTGTPISRFHQHHSNPSTPSRRGPAGAVGRGVVRS